jgi:hypothetical protein
MIRKFTFSEHFNSQYYKGTISFFPGDDTNQTYYDSFSSLFFSGPVGTSSDIASKRGFFASACEDNGELKGFL